MSGRLLATGDSAELRMHSSHASASTMRILDYLRDSSREFDLIHDESGASFVMPRCPVPVLATLHLPRSFYREEWFAASRRPVIQLRLAVAGANFHRICPT